MNNPVLVALTAALFYGFSGPLMRVAHNAGISTRDFVLVSSLCTVIISLLWVNGDTTLLSRNPGSVKGLWLAIPAAIILTFGFIFLNSALALPGGFASMVLVISSINPLIGSFISLIFLDEAKRTNLIFLICGSVLIFAGTVLVALSFKNP